MPTNATVEALRAATAGLAYQSETDAPWTAFAWPDAAGEPTPDEVRRRGKHTASGPVTEQSLVEFFAPLVANQDWYGDEEKVVAAKYRTLLAAIKGVLAGPKVIRVGDRKVTLYVIGTAQEGGWAGLITTAVET